MNYFFIDTCVWLNLAKDRNANYIVTALEDLRESGDVHFVVPQLVKDEFLRNKERVVKSARQRLEHEFKQVKHVVKEYGTANQVAILTELNEINAKLPIMSDVTDRIANRLISFMDKCIQFEITDDIKLKVVERALEKKAPFHNSKNNFADALLIESFGTFKRSIQSNDDDLEDSNFYFISGNYTDFSAKDRRRPHEDFSDIFDEYSYYFLDLVSAVNKIDDALLEEYEFELNWGGDETRSLSEILDYMTEFDRKIWYNRHLNLLNRISSGEIEIVPPDSEASGSKVIHEDVLVRAKSSAKLVEKEYSDIIPKDDFEWGMINGKLSALRWVLGDEWDMLDT